MPYPIVALGRSEAFLDCIKHLNALGYPIKAVLTAEPYQEYQAKVNAFEEFAQEIGAEFHYIKSISEEFIRELLERTGALAGVSMNWQFRLPPTVLDAFPYGILNAHIGRLPDYKANATFHWLLAMGESEAWADIHQMDPELDAGHIFARAVLPLTPETYLQDLLDAWAKATPGIFAEALERRAKGADNYLHANSPEGLRCYPRTPHDHQLNWELDAHTLARTVHASSSPLPGAYTYLEGDKPLIIHRAFPLTDRSPRLATPGQVLKIDSQGVWVACGQDVLVLEQLSLGQGPAQPAQEVLKRIRSRLVYVPGRVY